MNDRNELAARLPKSLWPARLSRRGVLVGSRAAVVALGLAGVARGTARTQDATPGATPAEQEMGREGLERLIQFVHPQKEFGYLPGFGDDEVLAAVYGVDAATYREITGGFEANARRVAEELLAGPAVAGAVDRLPFERDSTVAVVGESSTDDLQSWLAVLRHLLDVRRPDDRIRLLDQSASGRTTTEALENFIPIVNQQPDWIICFLGGNDASRYGADATKTLVSIEETRKNFDEMRRLAETQTGARWVWLTMYAVLEDRVAAYPPLREAQLAIRNDDIIPINDYIRAQPEPVVDLEDVFGGVPPTSAFLLPDGFHPSLDGHKAIVEALVERLAS